MAKYDSILGTVGNTPVVRIKRLAPKGVELYAKLETFNPLGSVKDRLALGIIEAAERDGSLKPGQTVVEATSGNTGIGLAMVCAVRGYPLVVTMAESFSVERRKLLRMLGAKVVLTPASERFGHARQGPRTRSDTRLVHGPTVRERGRSRHPFENDRAGDPCRLQGRTAGLLGLGFRHRRHPEGCGPRAESELPEPGSSRPNPTTPRCSVQASRSPMRPTAAPPPVTRRFGRI